MEEKFLNAHTAGVEVTRNQVAGKLLDFLTGGKNVHQTEEVMEETEEDLEVVEVVDLPALIVQETLVLEQTLHTPQHQTHLHSQSFQKNSGGRCLRR